MTRLALVLGGLAGGMSAAGCQAPAGGGVGVGGQPERPKTAAEVVISPAAATAKPPYSFGAEDDRFLDEVQHAAFLFLWNACDVRTGMVVDRTSVKFASTAGVGFQLAALPIGVERGWVKRAEAEARAVLILKSLESTPNNRMGGLFYHFLDGATAEPMPQDVVSTIDSTILFCGMLTASSYFGGEVRERGDRLFAAADWSFFVEQNPKPKEPHMKGFISLGWKPDDYAKPIGKGSLRPYYWADCGDEHRLVCMLAASAPDEKHRVDPQIYYKLRRPLGEYKDTGLMVYLPWSGALFTNFFAHCFVNYAAMGTDDPAANGVPRKPKVDWWENSRRHIALHRLKAREASDKFPNLGENAWGLTACDVPDGYGVPGVYPTHVDFPDMQRDIDYHDWKPKDDFGGGVLGCYGAGCSVMFEPKAALAALRNYRGLKNAKGDPLVWRELTSDPANKDFGFRDSFNAPKDWVAPDYVSIDQGPLVLAIENARTGRVWTWFHAHPAVQAGLARLKLPSPPNKGK